jgi:hypothetical protein
MWFAALADQPIGDEAAERLREYPEELEARAVELEPDRGWPLRCLSDFADITLQSDTDAFVGCAV